MLKKFLKEPLIHFLVIGGLIFFVYGQKNGGFEEKENRIVITKSNFDRLIMQWKKKHFRNPTKAETDEILEEFIYHEVMYREALVMGLDKNDIIIQRRLSQKLEFLSSDILQIAEPTNDELQEYLNTHSEKFMLPSKLSFTHVYIDTNKHTKEYFEELKKDLESGKSYKTLGDPFMFAKEFTNVTQTDVSKVFGRAFAKKIFSLHVDSLQGPIRSGYGLHFVNISKKTDAKVAKVQDIKSTLTKYWKEEKTEQANSKIYQDLKKQYNIEVQR